MVVFREVVLVLFIVGFDFKFHGVDSDVARKDCDGGGELRIVGK